MLSDDEKHKRAYGDGAKDSKNTGDLGHFIDELGELLIGVIPHWKDSKHESYKAGWRDHSGSEHRAKTEKKSNSGSSYGGGGGGYYSGRDTSASGALMGLLFVGLVIALPIGICAVLFSGGNQTSQKPESTYSRQDSFKSGKNDQQKNQQLNLSDSASKKSLTCDQIIKKIKNGKNITIPTECETAYQLFQEQIQANSQIKEQKDLEKNLEIERQSAESQNQQRIESDKRAQNEQWQREETARVHYELREKERQQAEADKLKEQQAENKRQRAKEDAIAREEERQRKIQEKNNEIIRIGTDIKNKIIKKN